MTFSMNIKTNIEYQFCVTMTKIPVTMDNKEEYQLQETI